MKNNIVVFYVKGIHPLDEYIEKISFEELRIKDNMSDAEINEIIKDYYENVFLEEVPWYYYECYDEYIFWVDWWKKAWNDVVPIEELNINDSTTEEEREEILQNYFVHKYLWRMNSWWIITKKEV